MQGETHVYKKILVCLDGSDLAEKVLPYAIEEASHANSELVLFMAISEPYFFSLALPGMPSVPLETQRTEKLILQEEKEARGYLSSVAEKIRTDKNLNVSFDTRQGNPGPTIVSYCNEQGIELIAIATHGRTGPGRVVLGSVADYVIRQSGLPILLIRPQK
jgi:nucleotide-binding universal stress UspA family protein